MVKVSHFHTRTWEEKKAKTNKLSTFINERNHFRLKASTTASKICYHGQFLLMVSTVMILFAYFLHALAYHITHIYGKRVSERMKMEIKKNGYEISLDNFQKNFAFYLSFSILNCFQLKRII